ncbi:MAG: carbohydrate ABC transporter permease [Actinomycetota bacterium]
MNPSSISAPNARTFQTSIKFTRDVAARTPVIWGYETTANAYNAFWLSDDDTNMWAVLGYILAAGLVALVLGQIGRRSETGWPWYLGVIGVLAVALWAFPRVFEAEDEYRFFINSLIVTVLTVLISISIGLLAGYGLARYTGISGVVILIVALGFRALPRTAFVLPYYFSAQRLGILDSRLVIVMALVAVNQPFTIWMLRTFFMDVPREMEEAAMMDGATRLQAFRKVIVPMMWPGIIATALFTMLLAYNEFLFVRVLAPTNWTLPVAIVSLTGGESSRTITEAAAASVSITLPIVVVIILFQRHLVKGLGAGAVKG